MVCRLVSFWRGKPARRTALAEPLQPVPQAIACGFFIESQRGAATKTMIIVFKPNIAKKDEAAVLKEIKRLGYRPHIMRGVARTVVAAIGDELTHKSLETLITQFPHAVESVMPVQKRFKLVSREAHPANSTIKVRGLVIGGRKIQIMAGPCSVESERQLLTTAQAVKAAGATILRGGAFKPRTS